jgi:phosphoribosylformylglycinamidine synthase PurS subunit
MRYRVTVTLREGILDPQGKAVKGALENLGFDGVEKLRVGKVIDLTLSKGDVDTVHQICKQLLVNPVIEDYQIETLEE